MVHSHHWYPASTRLWANRIANAQLVIRDHVRVAGLSSIYLPTRHCVWNLLTCEADSVFRFRVTGARTVIARISPMAIEHPHFGRARSSADVRKSDTDLRQTAQQKLSIRKSPSNLFLGKHRPGSPGKF